MSQRTFVLVSGPRPLLGYLVFDDGTTYQVCRNYEIGRFAVSEASTPGFVAISLEDGGVSRRHLRLSLEGWNLVLKDLGSRNGTTVQQPDDPGPKVVAKDDPVILEPGAKVSLGGTRTFVYEALNRPSG